MTTEELKKSRHLIVGMGEVGEALHHVIGETFYCAGFDPEKKIEAHGYFDFIHIAFPHSEDFVDFVDSYRRQFGMKGTIVVIHSTVPIGTTEKIESAVHSPIRGRHPYLVKGIRTFAKFVGGPVDLSLRVSQMFNAIGIGCIASDKSRNTEALKLWDTLQYGLSIMVQKEIKAFCDANRLDYSIVYDDANQTYNDGYRALGEENVMRPRLQDVPGKIGGHCVIPNAEMLDSKLARDLRVYDSML